MPAVPRGSRKITLRAQALDADGAVVDLTSADEVLLVVRTSRGDRFELAPTWTPNGNDGLIEALLPDACWRLTDWITWQIRATWADRALLTNPQQVTVTARL